MFPAGAARLTNVNDFVAQTAFGSILISGNNYNLGGNPIVLGSSLASQGTGNAVALDMTLSADSSIANTAAGAFVVTGSIDLNGNNLSITTSSSGGASEFHSTISGAGNLTIQGNGRSILYSTNSYSGTTTVAAGVVVVKDAGTLGSGDGTPTTGTTVNTGQLKLEGAFTVAGEYLTLNGGNTLFTEGDVVWSGGIQVLSGTGQIDINTTANSSL